MLILPSRDLWRPDRHIWTPEEQGRTRRRGRIDAPPRGLRQTPLEAAIARTFVGSVASGTNATSYTITPSSQPTTNRLQLLAVSMSAAGSTPNSPTVTGNGLTYTAITSATYVVTTVGYRVTLFRALGTTTGSGNITISFGASTITHCNAVTNEFDGVDTSGTNGSGAIVQSSAENNGGVSHTAGTYTMTALSAFANANNRPYVCATDNVNGADWTPLTNFSGLGNAFENSPANVLQTIWRSDLADPNVGATHATTSAIAMIAVEIAAVAAVGAGAFIPESAFPRPMSGLGGLSFQRRHFDMGSRA